MFAVSATQVGGDAPAVSVVPAAARRRAVGRRHRLLDGDLHGDDLVDSDDGDKHEQREERDQVRRAHRAAS